MLFDDEVDAVLRQIRRGPRPWATMNVWLAVIRLTDFNAAEIRASAAEIAERAEVEPIEVYRAMKRLMEIGAVSRVARGRYRVNEAVSSRGNLRLAAEGGVLVPSP
jgi:DNA-binding IclR family transcriptional regulator